MARLLGVSAGGWGLATPERAWLLLWRGLRWSVKGGVATSKSEGSSVMRIGELARRAGVSAKTLRFYESEGLLPPPPRTASGYRDFPTDSVDRVRFIKTAQAAGFTLSEIRSVLAHSDRGERPCDAVRDLIARRIEEVERKMKALEETRARLAKLARGARSKACRPGDRFCRIITEP